MSEQAAAELGHWLKSLRPMDWDSVILCQGKFAELLLNYRLQMKVYGCDSEAPNANKGRENRLARIGQVELETSRKSVSVPQRLFEPLFQFRVNLPRLVPQRCLKPSF